MKKSKKIKPNKKQLFIISAEPYNQDIVVAVDADLYDVKKFLSKLKNL